VTTENSRIRKHEEALRLAFSRPVTGKVIAARQHVSHCDICRGSVEALLIDVANAELEETSKAWIEAGVRPKTEMPSEPRPMPDRRFSRWRIAGNQAISVVAVSVVILLVWVVLTTRWIQTTEEPTPAVGAFITATMPPTYTPTPTPTYTPSPLPTGTPVPTDTATPMITPQPLSAVLLEDFSSCDIQKRIIAFERAEVSLVDDADALEIQGTDSTWHIGGVELCQGPRDLSAFTRACVRVFDTVGTNTVGLRLYKDMNTYEEVWSDWGEQPQRTEQGQWVSICWPLDLVSQEVLSSTSYIGFNLYAEGLYLFTSLEVFLPDTELK
jgi:hypothetical protein